MAEPPVLTQDSGTKKRALMRLVVALALIGAAILGLNLVDKLTVPDKPRPALTPSVEIAPAPPPSAPAPEAAPAAPPVPEAATVSPPPPPEVSSVPEAAPAPKTPDAKPTLPPLMTEAPAPSTPEVAPAPKAPSPSPAPAPVARKEPSTPMLKLEEAPLPPGKGYTIQMGVFTSHANAEFLLGKLKEKGVPAYTESKVIVGPFLTRREAQQAAATLKELGMRGVITPPKR